MTNLIQERIAPLTESELTQSILASILSSKGTRKINISDEEIRRLASDILLSSKSKIRSILSFENRGMGHLICWTRTKKGDPLLGEGSEKKVKLGSWVKPDPQKEGVSTLLVGIEVKKNTNKLLLSAAQMAEDARIFALRARMTNNPRLAPFIVPVYVNSPTPEKIRTVVELGLSNLTYLLKSKYPLEERLESAKQMLTIVANFHAEGFVHNDLKPANFLLMRDRKTIKLTDFDFTQEIGHEGVSKGTPHYMAPELYSAYAEQTPLTQTVKLDAWSLGCSLFEIFTQKRVLKELAHPNPLRTLGEAMGLVFSSDFQEKIDALLNSCDSSIPPAYQPIIRSLLRVNPEQRATVIEACVTLQHTHKV